MPPRDRRGNPTAADDSPSPHRTASGTPRSPHTAAPTPAPIRSRECTRTTTTPPATADRWRPAPPLPPAPGWAPQSATHPGSPPAPSPSAPDAAPPPNRPDIAPPSPSAVAPAPATAPPVSFLAFLVLLLPRDRSCSLIACLLYTSDAADDLT